MAGGTKDHHSGWPEQVRADCKQSREALQTLYGPFGVTLPDTILTRLHLQSFFSGARGVARRVARRVARGVARGVNPSPSSGF